MTPKPFTQDATSGFVNMKVPVELVERVSRYVELGGEGYPSRTAFVAEALRHYLQIKEEQLSRRALLDETLAAMAQEKKRGR